MNRIAANPMAFQNDTNPPVPLSTSFRGFEPLDANYVYCPNQFFDICLKSNSRGMVRIVAYILRQTLGWLDENGQPVHQTVKVSYSDLIRKAGVSRGAIAPAIQKAIALGFLECHRQGEAKGRNKAGHSASYTLRWDYGSEYKKSMVEFHGFFAGEGNRTPVPNAFFDIVIPFNSLAISKVVGAVIRNSVGYQNQFGHRKQHVSLSYSNLQFHTGLSDRSTLSAAIRESVNSGFIACLDSGVFDPHHHAAATYGLRWLEVNKNRGISSKTRPENSSVKNRFKNQTSFGSKTRLEDRFKNQTSIEKTETNNTFKQQAAVASVLAALIEVGFDTSSAKQLIRDRGVDVIQRQLAWIDARNPKSTTAMLRRAIENDWEAPEKILHKEKIAKKRDRLTLATNKLQEADRLASEKKRQRLIRKQELLKIWKQTSISERRWLIEAAAQRVTGERLSEIIRKQPAETENPHHQILDEIESRHG